MFDKAVDCIAKDRKRTKITGKSHNKGITFDERNVDILKIRLTPKNKLK